MGDIMIYGRGAGALPTGSAIVSDVVFCARQVEHARYSEMFDVMGKDEIITDFESEYYLRLNARDVQRRSAVYSGGIQEAQGLHCSDETGRKQRDHTYRIYQLTRRAKTL